MSIFKDITSEVRLVLSQCKGSSFIAGNQAEQALRLLWADLSWSAQREALEVRALETSSDQQE